MVSQHEQRKNEHLFIAEKLYQENSFSELDQVHLLADNLPEKSLEEINIDTNFLGHHIDAPFFINAITGGSKQAKKVNAALAKAAAKTKIPLAVGSESIAIKENKSLGFETIRAHNPKEFVLGNLSAKVNLHDAKKAVELISADALEIHLNVGQELIMPEGERSFHWLNNIKHLNEQLSCPLLVKEVGMGMTPAALKKLQKINIKYVDLSGSGGTNFIAIENERRPRHEYSYLKNFGLSTARALIGAQPFAEYFEFTASGGIRNALDIVKCLVLGASNVGISGWFLHILFKQGPDALVSTINDLKIEIKKIMLLLGCSQVSELSKVPYTLGTELYTFKQQIHNL